MLKEGEKPTSCDEVETMKKALEKINEDNVDLVQIALLAQIRKIKSVYFGHVNAVRNPRLHTYIEVQKQYTRDLEKLAKKFKKDNYLEIKTQFSDLLFQFNEHIFSIID